MEEKRTKIKINDLPKDAKIGEEELKRVRGGLLIRSTSLDSFYKLNYHKVIESVFKF
jgi:hypothetical protein